MQAANLTRLALNERRALEAFTEALRRDLDDRLLLVALFGSKARGDAHPDADLDLLVVTQGEARDLARRLGQIAAAVDLEHNVLTNVIHFDRDRWEDFARRRAAFWQNVQRDGMLLLRAPRLEASLIQPGTGALALPDHGPETAAYLTSAWQALRTAESNYLQGTDYPVVANRAYYAVFYAANAVLATQGLQRSKHPSVLALFRERFVGAGGIEPSFVRDYEEAMKRRHLSDYDLSFLVNAEFVRVGLEAAQRFTSRIERYLVAGGYLPRE